jgi:hypothetical protein
MNKQCTSRAVPDRAGPSGASPGLPSRSGSAYSSVEAAQRVAMFARALDRGEQPAYAVAGLLDDFNAAQIATLQGMAPPSTHEEPG